MDSDSVNRALDRVRERLRDWVLSGTTKGAEQRRSALGGLVKAFFVPCVLVLVGGSIFLSKAGTDLGIQNEAPHKLLGTLEETYANSISDESGSAPAVVEEIVKDLGEELVEKAEPKKRTAPAPTATPVPEVVVEEAPEPVVSVENIEKSRALTEKPDGDASLSLAADEKSGAVPRTFLNRSVFPATFGFGKSAPILLTQDLELFKLIIKGCSGTVVIEGHSDGLGTPARNDSLSRSRASAVSQLLMSRGLLGEGQRFEVVSMGGNRPMADDSTDEGRAANRRVEIWCRK